MSQEYDVDNYEMNEEKNQNDIAVDSQNYLIFVTDSLKFGVNAEYVIELITNHVITFLPRLPEFILGIINLRGQMIPIVDMRLRLGKFPKEDNDLIIVLEINGTMVGIMVDAVDQMISIPDADIQPMPAQNAQPMVSGMCTLSDGSGTMMVLDCIQLVSHE